MTDTTANAKFALRYAQNDYALFIDGVKVASNTTCSIPESMSDIEFDNGAGSNQLEANLKQFVLFPTALSDAQCSALTVEGLKEEILTSYIAAVDTLEDGAEARLDTYLQNLEDLIV